MKTSFTPATLPLRNLAAAAALAVGGFALLDDLVEALVEAVHSCFA